jgi:hypothetical protein
MNTASIVITLTGMTMEFFSLWFVAPEILGEDRLARLEHWIERPLAYVVDHKQVYPIIGGIAGGLLGILIDYLDITIVNTWITFFVAFIAGGFAGWLVVTLADRGIPVILSELARDEQVRRRAIVVGAVLFIIGFILQVTGVILGGLST